MLMKIIFINIGVFVVIRLVALVMMLYNVNPDLFLQYMELPSNPVTLLYRPWTLVTYMFMQYDILHILFNMLWLYWFGTIFMLFYSQKQLFGLYFLGGIGGAVLYLIAYNIFPYFAGTNAYLLGASASVIAIVVATALRAPDYKVGLLFLGEISLKWIAIVTILIDFLSIGSSNAGGHIAHLGGGLVGVLYGLAYKNGYDITRWFNNVCDSVANLFNWRPTVTIGKFRKKYKGNARHSGGSAKMNKSDLNDMNTILEKIKRSGYASLSAEEKRRLFEVSKKK